MKTQRRTTPTRRSSKGSKSYANLHVLRDDRFGVASLLLAHSAYLEPEKAPSPTELLAIGPAKAHSDPTAQVVAAKEESSFLRLKQIPINAIKGPARAR